jgi:hypothetical protein
LLARLRWWWAMPLHDPDARQAWKNDTALWIDRMPQRKDFGL